MADAADKLRLSQETSVGNAPAALFLSLVLERKASNLAMRDWSTSARSLARLDGALLRVSRDGHEEALLDRDGALIHVGLWGSRVVVAVAHTAEAKVDEALAWLAAQFPPPDPSVAREVTVSFWTYTPRGPMPSWRTISVPDWDEIEANYSAPTRAALEPLMRGFEPARGGQLVLWHGKAGTGKTYALRALAWEWREWCEFHYIVDPDTFFGKHADYLMNVLLQPAQAGFVMPAGMGAASPEEMEMVVGTDLVEREMDGDRGKAWKLLMLEDTGELLTADARAVIGQGLSRFLNVVDGLIGQGLRVLVLVTTNEEIRSLHPAVARPGRCAANVEFVPLAADEAAEWLSRHGLDERVSGPTTLAAVYGIKDGLPVGESEPSTGFAPV